MIKINKEDLTLKVELEEQNFQKNKIESKSKLRKQNSKEFLVKINSLFTLQMHPWGR